jgi:hypothetical protein
MKEIGQSRSFVSLSCGKPPLYSFEMETNIHAGYFPFVMVIAPVDADAFTCG